MVELLLQLMATMLVRLPALVFKQGTQTFASTDTTGRSKGTRAPTARLLYTVRQCLQPVIMGLYSPVSVLIRSAEASLRVARHDELRTLEQHPLEHPRNARIDLRSVATTVRQYWYWF